MWLHRKSHTEMLFNITLNVLFQSADSSVSAFCPKFPCSSFLPCTQSWLHTQPLHISSASSELDSHHPSQLESLLQSFPSSNQFSLIPVPNSLLRLLNHLSLLSLSSSRLASHPICSFVPTCSSQQCLKVTDALIFPRGFSSSQHEFLRCCLCSVLTLPVSQFLILPLFFLTDFRLWSPCPTSFSYFLFDKIHQVPRFSRSASWSSLATHPRSWSFLAWTQVRWLLALC